MGTTNNPGNPTFNLGGADAQKEYKMTGDAHSKLAGEEVLSTVLVQTGFKPANGALNGLALEADGV